MPIQTEQETQGLETGLQTGLNAAVIGALGHITTGEQLTAKMQYTGGSPVAMYNWRQLVNPIVNLLASPIADIDSFSGSSYTLGVKGPTPLVYERGVQIADSTTTALRCSDTGENNVGSGSFALLHVFYLTHLTGARSLIGKKAGASAASAGYSLFSASPFQVAFRISDGVDQISVQGVSGGVLGWGILLACVDRTANTFKLYTSVEGTLTGAAPTAVGSLDAAFPFGIGLATIQSLGHIAFLTSLWTGAENFTQAHLDNLKTYLGI